VSVRSGPRSDIDLFAEEVQADPFPRYKALRDAGEAVYLEPLDVWALPRYAEVKAALVDWKTFSSTDGIGFNDPMNQNMRGNVVTSDPPEHDHLRALLMERLSPREIRKFVDQIEQAADELVDDLVARRSFDAVTDLAAAFPSMVLTDLVGLSPGVRDKLVEWGDAAFAACGPMNQRTQEAFPAIGEVLAMMASLTKDDLRPESMGRAIFEAVERGAIPPEECVQLLWDYTGPGVDTTISAITTLLWQLGLNGDQLDALRKDPTLVPAACEEALRYGSPIRVWGRVARRDFDTPDGTTIPEGARVALMLGSANRDERHYSDPDRFDVGRNPVDHLAFGFGIHSCVGARLARAEMHAVVAALVKKIARIEVDVEPTRRLNNTVLNYAHLPITVYA
jgi:cytochrome P450